MSNRGEKHIHVLTTEGHKCMLNMQVTDVWCLWPEIAMPGAMWCSREEGGSTKHAESGQITKSDREDNVYRLKVSVAEPVFSQQGPQ